MGKEKKEKKKLPEHLELQRTHVVCGPELNAHVRGGLKVLMAAWEGTMCLAPADTHIVSAWPATMGYTATSRRRS